MVQALTGHECFQKYLHSKSRAQQSTSVHCATEEDDAEHTVFTCAFWEAETADLVRSLGRQPRPSDVQDLLFGPPAVDLPNDVRLKRRILENANRMSRCFINMVEVIMDRKQVLEREKQRIGAH